MKNIISLQEFLASLGSFTPGRLHMRLEGTELDYKPDEGMPPNPKAEAIFVHENIHYLQTCMTGYGQTVWNMYRQAITAVINMWQEATSSYKNKQIPLGFFAQNGLKEAGHAYFISATFIESIALDQFRDKTQYENISDAGLMLNNQKWKIDPEILLKGKSYVLQGRDIIESHAKHLESVYSFLINGIDIGESVNPTRLPSEYWFAQMWFFQEVGPERILEFPIICDLALQTVRCDPPKSEKEWRDSHPAWRFIKLTEALKENVVSKLSSIEDVIENYDNYVARILNHCDFASLDEVFSKSLSWYNRGQELLILQQKMRDPLLFRLNLPWCGANPFFDIRTWIEIKQKFTSPLIQVGPLLALSPIGPKIPPIDSKEMENLHIEFVGELHLQALALQILGIISQYSIDPEEIQCGYGYFGIRQGCAYQTLCNCPGSFRPGDGLPAPIKEISEEKVEGCHFGMFLMAYNINVNDLDVNFRIRDIPTLEELRVMADNIKKDDK